jgi:large subunit ribosomal protein L35Ae
MEEIKKLRREEALKNTTIPSVFVSHKRSKRKVYPRHALLRIENVCSREAARKYVGNCVEFIRNDNSVYGRISRVHGNSGVVCARFVRNLPPNDIGKTVFVKLYKINEDEV